MKILLVDDHVMMREGLELLLGSLQLRAARTCGRAAECLQALQEDAFDLVLLDLLLPDLDGITLVRELTHRHPGLPVLVLSVCEDIGTVVSAMQAGARGYLVKTATTADLQRALQTVAEGGCYLHARVACALEELAQPRTGWSALTPRDALLIGHVVDGLANHEIAERLHVSLATVKRDLARLFLDLKVENRNQLAEQATRRHWRRRPPAQR